MFGGPICRYSLSKHPIVQINYGHDCSIRLFYCLRYVYVTEFWKITHMVVPETIRIF